MQLQLVLNTGKKCIHAIIKEEKARRQKYNYDKQQQEIYSKAYKLFSEGKRPVEVAIALNLGEPEATKLFIEYWKLKLLHILNSIFKETNGKLGPFLKLYKLLIKQRGMSIEKVANVVDIDIHNLPYMESLYGQVKDEVDKMQRTRQETENYLHTLNDEIASSKELLQSYHISCERKRQEAENLNNEISRLETLMSRFKSDDGEYLKIKKTVEEEVNKFLTDGKVLLQFAVASVFESLRNNPGKLDKLVFNYTSASSVSISTPAQGSILSHIEDYRDMILEEAKGLYDSLLHHLTNSIMDNAAGASSSCDPKLSSTFLHLSNQSNMDRMDNSESFSQNKGDIAG